MRSFSPLSWAIVLSLACLGQAQASDPPRRVAVLPVLCLGIPKAECTEIRNQLSKILDERSSIRMLKPARIEAAISRLCGPPASRWECLEIEDNLYKLCGRLKVDTIEFGKIVAMDKAQVLRLRLVDCSTRTVTWENIEMTRLDLELVKTRSLSLYDRMFPAPQPEPVSAPARLPADPVSQAESPAWYQKWQTWVFSGTLVAIMVGGLVLGLQSRQDSEWDFHLSIP